MKKTAKIILKYLGIKSDFEQIFFKNELKVLLGRNNRAVFLLAVIYIITWLSLGYAIGGLSTLSKRMNNPYTNWVDWQIPHGQEDKLTEANRYFQNKNVRDSFFLKNITGYCKISYPFKKKEDGNLYFKSGRTLYRDDTLLCQILSSQVDNVISGISDISENDQIEPCGLIVKESMLQSLGYKQPSRQHFLPLILDTQVIYIPILAVVRDLPNLCDFILFPELYNALTNAYGQTGFIESSEGSSYDFCMRSNAPINPNLLQTVNALIPEYPLENVNVYNTIVLNDQDTILQYKFILKEKQSADTIKKIQHIIKHKIEGLHEDIKWNCPSSNSDIEKPYYAAFNFSRLDKVGEFKILLKERFQIDISMDQVEAKKNFALVSDLTYFVSIALFIFSIMSIVLFINSKLHNHLEQNRANLGTFKAFGLDNKKLVKIYSSVIVSFLSIGLLYSIIPITIFYLFNIYRNFSVADLFNYEILASFSFLYTFCIFVSVRTIKSILKDTPGNLIYGRQDTVSRISKGRSHGSRMSFFAKNKKAVLITLLIISLALIAILTVRYINVRSFDDGSEVNNEVVIDNKNTLPDERPLEIESIEVPRTEVEQQADSYNQERVKEMIESSPFESAVIDSDSINCEKVFKEYEREILESIRKKEYSAKLLNSTNDPILNQCLLKKEFSKRYEEIQIRLEKESAEW